MQSGGRFYYKFYDFLFSMECCCYPSNMKWVLGIDFEIIGKISAK